MRGPLDGPPSAIEVRRNDPQALDLGGCSSRDRGALVPNRCAAALGRVASGPVPLLAGFREPARAVEVFAQRPSNKRMQPTVASGSAAALVRSFL
jgi:hypothetical protein